MPSIHTNSLFTTVQSNHWNPVHAQWWNELLTGQHLNCYTPVDVIGYLSWRHPPLIGYRTSLSSMYRSDSSEVLSWKQLKQYYCKNVISISWVLLEQETVVPEYQGWHLELLPLAYDLQQQSKFHSDTVSRPCQEILTIICNVPKHTFIKISTQCTMYRMI
jgi:hypothetical protein